MRLNSLVRMVLTVVDWLDVAFIADTLITRGLDSEPAWIRWGTMLGKSRSRRTTRLVFSTLFLAALLLCPRAPLHAQQPRPQVSVTGAAVYARAFGDGGTGVAIDALRALPVTLLGTEHAFGLSAWYAKTAIASGDPFGRRRTLAGVGVQWQAGSLPFCASTLPALGQRGAGVPSRPAYSVTRRVICQVT